MSMIVARMQKMKAENLMGIGNHNQRKTESHSNKEIDIDRSYLNYDLVDHTKNYKKDIEKFINENKSSSRAIRKDAVLVNEWIISSDRDFFENLSESETENFFERVKDYFAENFGENNIRYATVHLDETTPHMHMGIVPFDKDNKLSAKRVFNRVALQDIQEELPKYLKELGFEIERGQKGSERKNLTVPEFKEMKNEQKELEKDLENKKNELLAYNKKVKIDNKLDIKLLKEIKEVEVETEEKTIFGKPKMEKIEKWTGNLIISEKDYLKMSKAIKHGKEAETRLNTLLQTDIHKENKELKEDNKELVKEKNEIKNMNNKIMESFNHLQQENSFLKDQISDLKNEISFIYQSTKNFLKERMDNLEAFKSLFKELVHEVSEKLSLKGLDNHFKKEYDKENRVKASKKPSFDIENLKRKSEDINKVDKKEESKKKNQGMHR